MADVDSLKKISAILDGISHASGDIQALLADQLLTELQKTAPEVARICAPLLAMVVDDPEHAAEIRRRFQPYRGDAIASPTASAVDLLVVAPKVPERDAILRALGLDLAKLRRDSVAPGLDILRFEVGHVTVGLAWSGQSGVAEATHVTQLLLNTVSPRCAALIGMAAGAKELRVGDVVIGEGLWNYEFERIIEAPVRPDPAQEQTGAIPAGRQLRRPNASKTAGASGGKLEPPRIEAVFAARERSAKEVQLRNYHELLSENPQWGRNLAADIRSAYPELCPGLRPDQRPKFAWDHSDGVRVKRGHILSGNKISEGGTQQFLAAFHDRAIALEMEGYGFALACDEADIPWVVVRGISDHGERRRVQNYQAPATFAATRYFFDLLMAGYVFPTLRPR